ncbi:helix-turn-helix domain-containing protein [Myroides odoratus]|uniref:Bacteriophage CI repressor helix-turn-helix domain n=1 Tax=Myroides odoratus TaxID=256 RepID=A0A378RIN2_MYROD|nr:helix-turn-helix domain-containing protein [Myroides odoratus]QQU02253.1 helix-turn-helix domain-containing protein [Myroides odoratus]STZ26824.1 Bacteriophage CI repressor helix-turn-helix domain [Myroides odoratus]
MVQANEVITRLKQLLGYKNDLQLAEVLDIKPNTLSTWKKRETLAYDKIIEVCKKYKIDLNDLFLTHPNSILNINLEDRRVKMISVDHHIEYFLNPEKCYGTSPSCVFSIAEEVDMAFQIGVENMFPTVKVSSYVLVKKIALQDILPWQIYVLVVENRGILCYRFKQYTAEGNLFLVSDNFAFENLEIRPEDVREVFCIHGAFLPNVKNLIQH